MKRLSVLLIASLGLWACGPEEEGVEALYAGGVIYTGKGEATVEAVAVTDGRVVFAGALSGAEAMADDETQRVDLAGAAMYPGFVDAHAHLFGVGQRELTFALEGTASIDELVTRLEIELYGLPPGMPLVGRGWIETHWPEARFPNRDDLDQVSPDNPVVLVRSDGHALVANSLALEAAGIDDQTADPDGGRIERDADGRATGMLIDNAMSLVPNFNATTDPAAIAKTIRTGADLYASRGWTGMHNMSVSPAQLDAQLSLDESGDLSLRVYNAMNPDTIEGFEPVQKGRVTAKAIKIFMDGALGSRGAALMAPYSDQPGTTGLMLRGKDETAAFFQQALDKDIQLSMHAIGDRANKLALDWMETAFAALPEDTDPRWRIEHAQILRPDDIDRFEGSGVIASMQPSHAIGDLHFAPSRLGVGRLSGAYAWRSLLDSGAVIAGGSDAPVEVGDPLIEFYAAVARKDLEGYSGEGWHPEQAVSRTEALTMFTAGPAYASFMEDELGTIEVGKIADFSVFDRDLMTIPAADILDAKPVMTVLDGQVVWAAD